MLEAALFPIPNVVAFPGTVLPLHVFEPRYRRLVHECLETGRLLAVSHVSKTIRAAPPSQSVEDALNTNQATYEPREVFSGGQCEIIEELPDGRILVQVNMLERLTLEEEIQSLPYRVVTCSILHDIAEPVGAEENQTLKESIHSRLINLVSQENPQLAEELNSDFWLDMAPSDYSFRIFQVLQFDPDTMQNILEMRTGHDRLLTEFSILEGKPVGD